MSENYEALLEAGRQLAIMKRLLLTYESATIMNSEGVGVDLTESQVTQLKQDYLAARTSCIAEIDKVVG